MAVALPSKYTLNPISHDLYSHHSGLSHHQFPADLDYCNSLLTGLPVSALVPLESVLNPATSQSFLNVKLDYITPLLKILQ